MKQTDNKATRSAADEAVLYLDGELFAEMVRGGAAQLRANAQEVNALNVFPVPDGDTGDNMSMTIEGGVAALDGVHTENLSDVAEKLSRGMLLGARGNSGVILSQFFAGMTKGFDKQSRVDAAALGSAMQQGVKQAYSAVITPTEGTILTVARESVAYAAAQITAGSTIQTLFVDLLKEAQASLQRTPELLPALKEANVIDSGGAGFFYIMQGFYKILMGEEIAASPAVSVRPAAPAVNFASFGADSEMTFGYCTELLLQLLNAKVDPATFDEKIIVQYLQTLGDSIVAFKTDSIVKIHVHTRTPEKVLAFCRQYGEFLTVKIENMSVQHSQVLTDSDAESSAEPAIQPRKEYAVVAVANGAGVESLFTQLGVDAVVHGGQTQNPSAQDFLAAFERVNAAHIFVFPNNGNIVMAAKQAAQMYEMGTAHVIESKDIGQGYAAISSLNFQSDDPAQIESTLREAMTTVTTGFISTAVRNAELNGVHIENGDYIGFVGKKMMVSCKDKITAATELLDRMIGSDTYLITAFIGSEASEEDVADLSAWLERTHADVEFYTVDGGQDVYPFIFVVE